MDLRDASASKNNSGTSGSSHLIMISGYFQMRQHLLDPYYDCFFLLIVPKPEIQGALPENPGCITGESECFFLDCRLPQNPSVKIIQDCANIISISASPVTTFRNVKCQMSWHINVKCQMSNVMSYQCQMSWQQHINVKYQMSNVLVRFQQILWDLS